MSRMATRIIWSEIATLQRWHKLWRTHLALQMETNPSHPGHEIVDGQNALEAYAQVDQELDHEDNHNGWTLHLLNVRQELVACGHEVVAAMRVYNRAAGRDQIHYGLTSSDITETAQQIAVRISLRQMIETAHTIHGALLDEARQYSDLRIVGYTHGQPAQQTTLGMRYATTVASLTQWTERAQRALDAYRMRPPGGAVGTGADLIRVLRERYPCPYDTNGDGNCGKPACPACGQVEPTRERVGLLRDGTGVKLEPDHPANDWADVIRYVLALARATGFENVGAATRQTYSREQDLHVIGLLVELAVIVRSWATDRRLESLQGLGNQLKRPETVGSSAMAQKLNPLMIERSVALSSLVPGHYQQWVTMSANEMLEGDVSTSAARKRIWPELFGTVEEMLAEWLKAINTWEPDEKAFGRQVDQHRAELKTGQWLHELIKTGLTRTEAHEQIRLAMQQGQQAGPDLSAVTDDVRDVDPGVGWVPLVIGQLESEQI